MPGPIWIAGPARSGDYTDYSEAYDSLYSSGNYGGLAGYLYLPMRSGNTIDPRQQVAGTDHFKKMSHEVRVASPSSERFRVVAGRVLSSASRTTFIRITRSPGLVRWFRSMASPARCG